ncbi:hypothetical protein [Thermococcus sp.]|uniref:hypothetical protein n=1 Tax=Thermococcus sp. TaxID=35749 RepID=UPI002618B46B|nr:hypothetical protein [Thermococcus sp.]
MRGQISLDLLFAVMLVSLTVIGLVGWGMNQAGETTTMGKAAQLKVLAVDVRDSVAKVYASGPGFTVIKELPFQLKTGEWVNITLYKNQTLLVRAELGGKEYRVVERLQVPVGVTSSVLLLPGNETFQITAVRLNTGGVGVVVET